MFKILGVAVATITMSSCAVRDKWVEADTSPCVMKMKRDTRAYGRDWVDANIPAAIRNMGKGCNENETLPQPKEEELVIPTTLRTEGGTKYRLQDPHTPSRNHQIWRSENLTTQKINEE